MKASQTYRGNVVIEWDDKPVSDAIKTALKELMKKTADDIKLTARALCPVGPGKALKHLKESIEVNDYSKDNKIAYAIEAQGPGDYSRYYASFVELGTKGRGIEAKPFLRPSMKYHRNRMDAEVARIFQEDKP